MTIESELVALTTQTSALLNAVNVSKVTLDQKVADATSQAEISTAKATEAALSAGEAASKANLLGSVASTAATGTVMLTSDSAVYQLIDPNGAARDVVLPTLAAGDAGRSFAVKNTGTAGNYLTVKIAAGTQLGPLVGNGYSMAVVWSGTAWEVL